MNSKIMILMLIVVLVAAGGAYIFNSQNSDTAMDGNDMTKDMKDMEDDKDMDSDMVKDDNMMDNSEKMMNEGEMAPEFTLMAVDGMEYSLVDYKGQKVYIKFWASWCPICLSELEDINKLSATSEFPVLTIVSPGLGSEKDREDFIEWYKGLEYDNMIVLLDDGGDIAKEYMVIGYPASAYVGSDGVLVGGTKSGPAGSEAINEKMKGIY